MVYLVGHTAARAALKGHTSGIPVLIQGPEGIGKSLVVREWVGFLLAEHGVMDVAVSSYPLTGDVRLSPMAAVRQIEADLMRRIPSRGTIQRIVVIDMGWLSAGSDAPANALLLTLEDPPAGVQFILHASRQQLPTVESRCIMHRLSPLTEAECAEVLDSAGAENPQVLARLAGGRPGVGLQWARRLRLRPLAAQWGRAVGEAHLPLLAAVSRGLVEPLGEDRTLSQAEVIEAKEDFAYVVELLLLEAARREPLVFTAEEIALLTRRPVHKLRTAMRVLRSTARAEFRVRMAAQILWEVA